MADKLVCPNCGGTMKTGEGTRAGSGLCPSCGKQMEFGTPGADAQAGEPTKSSNNFGCLLYTVVFGSVLFLLFAWLLLPDSQDPEAVQRADCANNLNVLAQALYTYHDEYGRFPPPYTVDARGNRLHSWRTLILPYIQFEEGETLYKRIRLDEPWDSEHNRQFASCWIGRYHCPPLGRYGKKGPKTRTDYVMITGPGTISDGTEGVSLKDVTDPRGTTVMVAEVAGVDIHWMEPRDYDFAAGPHRLVAPPNGPIGPTDLSSYHPGIVNMLMVDGSVKSVPVDIDEKTLKALMTIGGGEEVELE